MTLISLTIDKENAVVRNDAQKCQWTLKTANFFGDVLANLEKNFIGAEFNKPEFYVANILKSIEGKKIKTSCFGINEFGDSLFNFYKFIDGRSVIMPSFKRIDEMRIQFSMTTNYLPISTFNPECGMRFDDLKTVTHVIIAALYYYTYNDYKLICCKHCKKWFATTTLKNEYCKRISPCFGDIINGNEPVLCEQAVRNIKQKQKRKHRNIYENLLSYAENQDDIDEFLITSKQIKESITQSPSVENFKAYENYLNSRQRSKRKAGGK